MATKEGIVAETAGGMAWVKTTRSSACNHCSAKGSCATGGDGAGMMIKVENRVAAQAGDRVVLTFKTASLLKAAFLIYVFPILCMLMGAVFGSFWAGRMGTNVSTVAAICGVSAFAAAILFMKFQGNRMGRRSDYTPKILRVIRANIRPPQNRRGDQAC